MLVDAFLFWPDDIPLAQHRKGRAVVCSSPGGDLPLQSAQPIRKIRDWRLEKPDFGGPLPSPAPRQSIWFGESGSQSGSHSIQAPVLIEPAVEQLLVNGCLRVVPA